MKMIKLWQGDENVGKIHISCMYGLLWPSSIIVIVHLRETTEYRDQETSIDHIGHFHFICQKPTSCRGKTSDYKYIVL